MRALKVNKKNLSIISGIAVFLFLLFAFIYFPLLKEIRKMDSLWKSLKEQLRTAENLRDFQKIGIHKRLVSQKELVLVLDKITEAAKSRLLNFKSISQQEIKALEGYRVLPVEMELDADYKQLGLFLGDLENLQDALVTVENLQVNSDEKLLPKILCSLTLNIYITQD
ncbi:MAG: hypothetical protein A3G37_03480 [Omnitrophica WOR_2 bacterium RIFCSPLOWO2_12_FULL_46_30]|nr:MAG: hypothetical protein A3H41_01175 [Omnitrophica WOR_2 bacterium RIFCSPLOWO2_02_FULL_45_28]OGX52305.1 MAG: hypothetical protein A3G37_03480 [Omnitrophica WOR_2 bacterium RIFCSPLOWO2_12_FULL_46_30]